MEGYGNSQNEGGKELDRLSRESPTVREPKFVKRVSVHPDVKPATTDDPEFNNLWNHYYGFVAGEVVSSSLDEPDASE